MVTLYLATVLGWYLVIISLFVLFRYEQVVAAAKDIMGQRGLFFIVAIITVILGLLMVVAHNYWVLGWPVIVTLFSWLVLISGLMRLLWPEKAMEMGISSLQRKSGMQMTSIVLLLIGLFLLWHVYYS